MSDLVLELKGITRDFPIGEGDHLSVLKGVDLQLARGEIVALVGPSGAGKSTLLQIAGLLEHPSRGEVWLNGQNVSGLNDRKRTRLRCAMLGFVYQYHHLLPEFSAQENVQLPQMILGRKTDSAARAETLLQSVGLGARLQHRPGQLSGGEQQRVAIARALANQPQLLLADEPTGNLDYHTAQDVFALLLNLVRETGLAALIATHNMELAQRMDRIVTLRDGVIVEGSV